MSFIFILDCRTCIETSLTGLLRLGLAVLDRGGLAHQQVGRHLLLVRYHVHHHPVRRGVGGHAGVVATVAGSGGGQAEPAYQVPAKSDQI